MSVDGPEVLLTIPVRARDARTALATARETATDLLLVLASTFNGYELVVDERQLTRRTDAVYQAEGPIPPLDVAEGGVTEYGVQSLDPNGELRRAGRVLTIRASAFVTHPPAEDVRRFAGRAAWTTKGRTSEPGLDVDTAYGQLLRRMSTEEEPAARYAVVVPTEALRFAERVPRRVRQLLRIDVYAVDSGSAVTLV